MDEHERRWMRRAPLAWLLVVALVAGAACSGSSDDQGSLDAPTGVEVERAEGDRPAATVSFDPVPDAEAYLVEPAGEAADPIRVEPEDCSATLCELTFGWMTAPGASSVTVRAVAGGAVSERSDEVALPEWSSPDEQDEPVVLLVTREGADGQPRVDTETVEPGGDIVERLEARITELQATNGVVDVDIQSPSSAMVPAQQPGDGEIPEGLATWQERAWTFDSLPQGRGAGVTVGVIDYGIDVDHPALRGADISTVNVVDPGADVEPDDHGTAVTSLIVGGPEGRVPGVAPGASVRFYGAINAGYDPGRDDDSFSRFPDAARLAAAMRQAVDDGVDLIITSVVLRCTDFLWSSPECPDVEIDPAVQYAEDNGVVVVSAAGNDADHELCAGWDGGKPWDRAGRVNADRWPAKLDTVIAVGAANQDGSRNLCSAQKDYIDVLAPGRRLRLPTGSNGYYVDSGTSFAAPLVAGLVATILSERPDLTPAQVRDLLRNGIVDDEGRRDPANRGRLIPLYVLRELGMLEAGATLVAGERDLFMRGLVTDAVWPYLGETPVSLDTNPEQGTATQALTEVLGQPAVTEPASWRGSGGGGGGEGPPEPGQDSGIPPPECWSGLYGLMLWGEGSSPTFGVLYAREELPLASGDQVPAGAVIGYRAYRRWDRVRMADGVEIGQPQAQLEEAYVDADGRPYRAVEFVDGGDEFELVNVDAPSGGGGEGRETTGALGPDRGQMSGHADPATDTIVERGAGADCGLEDGGELFAAACASSSPGSSADQGCGGAGPDPTDTTRPGPTGPEGPSGGTGSGAGHEMEITLEGAPDDLYLTVWGPTNPSTTETGSSCDGQPNSFRFYWEPGHATGDGQYDLEVFNWHCHRESGDPGRVLSFTIEVTVDGRALEPITGSAAPLEWWTHELALD